MRTLNLKFFITLILSLAWTVAQADPAFTFTHVGGGETGSLTKNAEGSYTLIGGGNDIWDVSDEFDFAQTQVSGDFDVSVRVQSLEFTATWTKAGVMVRESLAGDSKMAWNRVTPDDSQIAAGLDGANDTRFSYRTGKTGGAGSNDGQHEEGSGAPEYPNAWLRLQREGNVVTAYASNDGLNWRVQGAQDTATWAGGLPLPNTVYLGLAVSRHSGADPLATCEFRDLQAPKISSQPASITKPEASPASFKIGLAGWANWSVQWKENGVDIPGQTGRTLSFAAVSPSQNGKRYSAVATDVFSGQVFTSTEAVLTVISDTFPATLVSAASPISPPSGTQFDLVYSEPVNASDAVNLANYSVSAGVTLLSATLQPDNKTVHFTCSDLYGPGCKVLTVNNVRDRAPTPNPIAANSQIGIVAARGSIRYHQYNAIAGTDIPSLTSNAKFPNFPDLVAYPTLFENPGGGGDHANDYGAQIVGFVHPPVSGAYKFFVSADDNAVLYLSTDENPANKVAVAREPAWAGFRNFIDQGAEDRDGNAANGAETINAGRGPAGAGVNISAPITLQAGCKYYAEFLFKEGGGGDYGSVAWQIPGGPAIANGSLPISAAYLSPFDVPATVTGGPNDVTTPAGRLVTFSATIAGSPSLLIQWYKNGVAIDGATSPSITVGPVKYPDDNGATFYVIARNDLATAQSRTATLTVENDTVAPTVLSVGGSSSFDAVAVQYSEIMDSATATDGFNYTITGPGGQALVISAVTLSADGKGVIIQLDNTDPNNLLQKGALYTVSFGAVTDVSGNLIADGTTKDFRAFVEGCGGLIFEAYATGGGNDVSILTSHPTFPNNPDFTTTIFGFDTTLAGGVYANNGREGYGGRVRGLYVPPVSGDYVFYLRSDDAGQLWLNPNGPSASGKVMIVNQPGCCNALGDVNISSRNMTLNLTGGQPYYIEGLYKEGTGGDYLQIGAQLRGSTDPVVPIGSRDLGQFAQAGSAGSITITQQPADVSVEETKPATFTVQTANDNNLPTCYQWQRDGVDIAGATGSSYSFLTAFSDSGAKFSVRASIVGMVVQSSEATLTVTRDTIAPQVTSVSGSDTLQQATVRFSELVNADDASDTFNYTVTGPGGATLAVSAAVLLPDGMSVLLTTDPQTSGQVYTVSVTSVRDRALEPNVLDPAHSSGSFTAFTLSCGFLVFEAWHNIPGNAVSALTTDPRFPNSPTERAYATAFDSRTVYADDSHEGYGGRLHGVFVPPASGNWIFYLKSDDASELWLNPTGTDPAGKVKLGEELGCCRNYADIPSAPQALTAGQAYYIEGLYKEGGGGDYIQVAAKLDSDPTPPNSLHPISANNLGLFANPVGASVAITTQPQSQTVCLSGIGANTRTLASENFNSGNGGFTVSTVTAFSGPWVYDSAAGTWHADGQSAELGAAMTSRLSSPSYTVTRAGVLRLSFAHRYSFEFDGTRWDGGQVRVSINGGAYAAVPASAFVQNGYNGTVAPNSASAIAGQAGFTAESDGHAAGTKITSIAELGSVFPGDTVSVQFLYAADTNTRGAVPNWEVDDVVVTEGNAGQAAARFTVAANTAPAGAPVFIQWQRNTGSGWVDVNGGTGATYTFNPSVADNGARYRATIYTLGATATSSEATLTVIQANTPPSFTLSAGTVVGAEDGGAYSLAGLATDIKPHSIVRVPVAFASDFSSMPPGTRILDPNGPATGPNPRVEGGVLKLTEATDPGGFGGFAIGPFPQQIFESVEAKWKSRVGGGINGGADGYSMNIGNDLVDNFTGEEGTGTGLSVTVDTFDNGGGEAPGIEIKWRGTIVAFKAIPKDDDGSGNYLRKDQFVDASLTVSPTGAATYTYDGNQISAQLDSYAGIKANQVIFGARTGGANDNQWIDDLDLKGFPYDLSSAESGQHVTFTTSNNNPSLFSAQPAVSPDGTLTFTPAPNAFGQATVSVTASDDGGTACEGRNTSQAQTFVIDIGPTPDRPVANSQSVNAVSGAATPITLTGSDIDGDALTFRIVSNPAHGTATTDSAGHAVYTSAAGYVGPDSFTFVANDGTSDSAPATVSITVAANNPPVCVATVVPPTCVLSYNNDGKKYILSLNGDDACVLLDGSGSTSPGGGAVTISWIIDGTNTVAGTTVPVCLPVGCHNVEMVATAGGGTCRQRLEICVITTGEALEQIVALVENTQVDRKNKRPLIATLKAAAASYDRDGHDHTAANQLNAFQNKVRAQIGRTNPAEAQKLIDAVKALVDAVGCAEAVEAAQQGN